jgi:glycosyltransferase involved in cell wall biosynthesis
MLTCNRPRFLSRAIRSVLTQELKDWELIVVQDGSNEQIATEMREWQQRDPRILFLQREMVGSIGNAGNFALCHAQGEYVAILDDDDCWDNPKKLLKQVRFLDHHLEHVACGGGMIAVNEDGVEIGRFLKPELDGSIKRRALLANPMVNSTAMYRRASAQQIGGYDDAKLAQFQDWDFWLRLGNTGRLYNFPEPLVRYTIWSGSSSYRHLKSNARSALRIVCRHRRKYPRFFPALILACAYSSYANLPDWLRSRSFDLLSRLKKTVFGQRQSPGTIGN